MPRIVIAALLLITTAIGSLQAENWPRFRGENGEGKAELSGVPSKWSSDDYEWQVELAGKGHSSPAVWQNRIYVTSGTAAGGRIVQCLDLNSGEQIWRDEMTLSANHLHKKNSYASGTPAVDGEHVYVVFADEKVYAVVAYTLNGEKVWTRDLGSFTSQHGQGVSPIVYKGLVIVPDDQKGPSKIIALNAGTGENVWVCERDFRRTSYSTPMILQIDGRDHLISLSGALGISAIDPQTGKTLWNSGELPLRTVASPVLGNGLLFASCGEGGRGKFMVAVDPQQGGKVVGERTQNLPYVPTPIAHEGYLFLWNDDGVVCCINPAESLTQNVWRERVGGNFSGSPILIDDRLFCISEDGEVVVIAAKPEYQLLGKSPLRDQSYSTPAVAGGHVLLRGFETLSALPAQSSNR